jgi:hypothetical protein
MTIARLLLMAVLRNATTDSPWPLKNNPSGTYNDPQRPSSSTSQALNRFSAIWRLWALHRRPARSLTQPRNQVAVDGGGMPLLGAPGQEQPHAGGVRVDGLW